MEVTLIPDNLWYLALPVLIGLIGYLYTTLFTSSGSEYQDNSIDAFIDKDDNKGNVPEDNVLSTDRYRKVYTAVGQQLLILYGTEYGFSEEISKRLFDRITEVSETELSTLQPRLLNVRDYNIIDWTQETDCFLVISTSGDGVPPTDARDFYEDFLKENRDLSHLSYTVLALGDTNYPHFCKTGRTLDSRFSDLGATRVVDRKDVDMEDWPVINSWIQQVIQYLYSVNLELKQDYLQYVTVQEDSYSRTQPFPATLKLKRCLTVCDTADDKETIHCEFDVSDSGLTWTSGDALGIYPQNSQVEVERLLLAMKCTGQETANRPQSGLYTLPDDQSIGNQASVGDVLTRCYDLKVVRFELLDVLHQSVTEKREKNKLSVLLTAGPGKDNSNLHNYLVGREVADVFEDFYSHTLSYQDVLKYLKFIQPRYYSISSSPVLDANTACVTAAVVLYETFGIPRTGVTTTYLSYRCKEGQTLPVFISHNPDFRLPSNHTIPIILIGPGTGIAPFRAFIQERGLQDDSGQIVLYFGCRHKNKDFLYKEELERWNSQGLIKLRTAFSRDQTEKVYVQDLLLQDQEEIWRLLYKESAHIYVCGDARHMAHDVHKSLLQIAQQQGGLSQSEARDFFTLLEHQNRYEKDVWVT